MENEKAIDMSAHSKIYSAFPATGKTWLYSNQDRLSIMDSDSSQFSKEWFPANYIRHIKENLDHCDVMLVSSHKEVRDALEEHNIHFNLVYPRRDLKEEYIERLLDRGSPQWFVDIIDKNWGPWMDELPDQNGCDHIVLGGGEYLSDIINENIKD